MAPGSIPAAVGAIALVIGALVGCAAENRPFGSGPARSGAAPGPFAPSSPPGPERTRASAVPPITVGEVEVDPPTFHCLGIALPVTGDTNHNAAARVYYRRAGGAWREALPLLRVHPGTLPDAETDDRIGFTVPEEFAGSIFDLEPDTPYEVRVEVRDPDGGDATRQVSVRTRALPREDPVRPRLVGVSDSAQLRRALGAAMPGDVIVLANGRYDGAIEIAGSGTPEDPIFVRGQSQDGVVLDAAGAEHGVTIRGSHVTVEGFTVRGSGGGVRLLDTREVVIRHMRITGVSSGIDGAGAVDGSGALQGHRNRDVSICDNILEGKEAVWPDVDRRLWNFEGIVITGSGHVVCHNRLSGFGDALGMDKSYDVRREHVKREWYAVPNRAIDFYGNDVLWGADDGIELDLTRRNVRAFRNRISNTGNGISFQPIWGGPAYAIRNVIHNTVNGPYKLNNDPSGFYILHNTAIRAGLAWLQYSGAAANFRFHNNLTIGTGEGRPRRAVIVDTRIVLASIDWNGWSPEGSFRFGREWRSFGELQRRSPYERNGALLQWPVFERDITVPRTHRALLPPLDDVTLHPKSNAVDAGAVLPNINDGFTGRAPDLGALERPDRPPRYGPRPRSR